MVQVPCRPDPSGGLPNAVHQGATECNVAQRYASLFEFGGERGWHSRAGPLGQSQPGGEEWILETIANRPDRFLLAYDAARVQGFERLVHRRRGKSIAGQYRGRTQACAGLLDDRLERNLLLLGQTFQSWV